MYLLRFSLYGLIFFAATSYLALGPYATSGGAAKFAAVFGALGAISFPLAAFSTKLLVQFYRELLEKKDE